MDQLRRVWRSWRARRRPRTATVGVASSNSKQGVRDHTAAGCLFTNGHTVLAGYQPHKKRPFVSGLGGGREGAEQYWETAFRETVEELFHVTPTPALVQALQRETGGGAEMLMKGGYVALVLDYEQLTVVLALCREHGVRSPLYETMPGSLAELLTAKRVPHRDAEVSHLCLLPLSSPLCIDDAFQQDLAELVRRRRGGAATGTIE